MKKILVFGATNSKKSINKQLAEWAGGQLENVSVSTLDLNDYEMPIYSIDIEEESGIPKQVEAFKEEISKADGIIISFAEHNGNYTVAYKNIFDWVSRSTREVYQNKPLLILSSSPGPGGAKSVLNIASSSLPYAAADVKGSFSLPSFHANFTVEEGISDNALNEQFKSELNKFESAVLITESV
ncbi:NADPH-dependent FMN reductase [Flammeovirga kamogawensis]|uniref:NAD(P)H-dependent oxidoreductase n=1 Tax=Flammeovirga kamogawensis TaxID=373891 RepID=A0ABX8GUF0_9BACT|nr:NAD(P)H-dependent oxidoreductase [Flammeovirga kamogawensis]MBB6459792.1 NAD(P)H-dependent FMN reductase [Flammeovirga kamogawensis]QWG07151.1 NAD(P)H-dependent oxidoreductase [Flammeovirga kamogawensis]TRX68973.1 NAD(P)H-dependent oxidoreductase [Flammeovirga kamogawensis]